MESEILHYLFGVPKSYGCHPAIVMAGAMRIPAYPLKQRFRCPACKSRNVIRQDGEIMLGHALAWFDS